MYTLCVRAMAILSGNHNNCDIHIYSMLLSPFQLLQKHCDLATYVTKSFTVKPLPSLFSVKTCANN